MKIQVVQAILSANDQVAAENRAALDAAGVFALNLMASPGAGKTSLILATASAPAARRAAGRDRGRPGLAHRRRHDRRAWHPRRARSTPAATATSTRR